MNESKPKGARILDLPPGACAVMLNGAIVVMIPPPMKRIPIEGKVR